uniref:G protein-coupled receptor kinase 1 a n=1 Tax=Hucho hucho TaxID=62062 RepID=A0A4W5Q977_9TELE
MDLSSLTTVVANSAYINARGSFDGSNLAASCDKKYPSRLKLPHIQCVMASRKPWTWPSSQSAWSSPLANACSTSSTSDSPYTFFLESMFLHWKWLDMQTMDRDWFLDLLGKGGFGEVSACQMKATGKLNACMKLNKKRLKKRKGYEVREREGGWSEFTSSCPWPRILCLVMTIMNGGDLKYHIYLIDESTRGLRSPETCSWTMKIHTEIQLCTHTRLCDVMLCDAALSLGNVRISDLGLTVELKEDQTKSKGYAGTPPARPRFMAPVLLKGEKYDTSVDYFILGVTLFEFMGTRGEELKECIMTGTMVYPETFSENGKSICSGLLEKQVDQRLGFKNGACDKIGAHPFFSGNHWREETGQQWGKNC